MYCTCITRQIVDIYHNTCSFWLTHVWPELHVFPHFLPCWRSRFFLLVLTYHFDAFNSTEFLTNNIYLVGLVIAILCNGIWEIYSDGLGFDSSSGPPESLVRCSSYLYRYLTMAFEQIWPSYHHISSLPLNHHYPGRSKTQVLSPCTEN